ncbi:beta-aspartyl-peptidase [Cupriavidus sp. USMAA2-4]|uniref:Beta-aspartyl-peptidase n=1 Tax=Cupriavidus malaysiensis TaxID=367825 RepID=A0ABM6FB91_9BURK|nr:MULTISPECIES: isoaspartyl peptidase/L-asparaginase [Cupriavidus]AOY95813.1 beta-aspartyl-peptidase [Cupriavidus sp. USMAA2-4]AOZ03672.1 beta-aspartyl-peptidase [Cupriavidus sp. USMAHM13]AOZ08963.1 beta-aspartyl-peptidase [Cupriavidus malaysiensis]
MKQAVIAIHGGAGTITRAAMDAAREREYSAALEHVLQAGQRILAGGGSALDAVTEAVRLLEECPLFNAGKGAVLTRAGTYELDAAVMDGATLRAGAVACVQRLRNPVLAARAVLEHSEHVLFAGEGAEAFAAAQGLECVPPGFYYTAARTEQWQRARAAAGMLLDHDAATLVAQEQAGAEPIDPDSKFGTVGAVACDRHGNLAAATSTGGVTNKLVGRVGDSPLIGAGCYADDVAAVSCTGTGEMFIRAVAAHDVVAQMRYAGLSLQEAARRVVMEKLPAIRGRGGLIAVDRAGNVALPFNTEGMYRGSARVDGPVEVSIYG